MIEEPDRSRGKTIDVFVEIPRGSRNKYEYDKARGVFRLDRVLFSSMHYPTDYGYIPDTLGGDGDPLDVLVLIQEPTFPGCLIEARPIGVLVMRDDKGEDEKILAVPVGDPRFARYHDLPDLAPHWQDEIAAFFSTYKNLEGKAVELGGWEGASVAWRIIEEARKRYKH